MSHFGKWPPTFVFYFLENPIFKFVSIMLRSSDPTFSVMLWKFLDVSILIFAPFFKIILNNGYKHKIIGYFRRKNG